MTFPGNPKSPRPAGIGAKLFASLFFLFFLGMGLVFVRLIAREALAAIQTWSWTSTPCEITRSEVRDTDSRGRKSDDFYFDVQYRYLFKGQTLDSNRHQLKATSSADYTKIARLTETYPAGSHAVCYVNPADPNQAVLQRGNLLFPLMILFPMIFVSIGAGGIYATWRAASLKQPALRPISDLSTQAARHRFATVFFGAFIVIGGLVSYLISVRPFSEMFVARHWPTVPCTIISSEVRTHRGNKGQTYSVNIFYSYVFNDHLYKANRYDFMGGSSSGYGSKQAIIARYPSGSTSVCYVNPLDPDRAVLERGFTPMMWIGLIPLVFCLLGFVGLTSTLRRKRQQSARNRASPTLALGRSTIAPRPGFPDLEERSTLTLQPGASPWTKFLISVIVALFWNGIISMFVAQVLKSWHSSYFEWFLILFVTPFVLLGLCLMAAIGYFFLALFNPRPRLTVTPGTPRLGDSVRVDWEINGRVESLKNLHLRLEGKEEVTYQSGDKTATERSVFARLDIASSTLPQEMRSGSGKVSIPADQMHSFTSKHNRIAWSIRIDGAIEWWPDLGEEFALNVRPAAPAATQDL